jgi:anti-sigma B factor antagonist
VRLKTDETDAAVVLRVEDARIDAHNAGELKLAIADLFAAKKRAILVDLSSVDFMDSSGLSALISGHKSASICNGALRLAGLRPQVKAIFELTRLHHVFEIFPSVEQGMESFRVQHDTIGKV